MDWWAILGGFALYCAAFVAREIQHHKSIRILARAHRELSRRHQALKQQTQATREELVCVRAALANKGVVSLSDIDIARQHLNSTAERAAVTELLHEAELLDGIDKTHLVVEPGNENVH